MDIRQSRSRLESIKGQLEMMIKKEVHSKGSEVLLRRLRLLQVVDRAYPVLATWEFETVRFRPQQCVSLLLFVAGRVELNGKLASWIHIDVTVSLVARGRETGD